MILTLECKSVPSCRSTCPALKSLFTSLQRGKDVWQDDWMKGVLVAFVWLFSTVHSQMCPQRTWMRAGIFTLVTLVQLLKPHLHFPTEERMSEEMIESKGCWSQPIPGQRSRKGNEIESKEKFTFRLDWYIFRYQETVSCKRPLHILCKQRMCNGWKV